jgi:hypothetical protein
MIVIDVLSAKRLAYVSNSTGAMGKENQSDGFQHCAHSGLSLAEQDTGTPIAERR